VKFRFVSGRLECVKEMAAISQSTMKDFRVLLLHDFSRDKRFVISFFSKTSLPTAMAMCVIELFCVAPSALRHL
jgi:hypothetical protein